MATRLEMGNYAHMWEPQISIINNHNAVTRADVLRFWRNDDDYAALDT